ncbi:hypothetical protein K2Q08_03625 [Patescibacteria group bacterium]|nr:hypothetical protein [Patescibacteria group bacterium]
MRREIRQQIVLVLILIACLGIFLGIDALVRGNVDLLSLLPTKEGKYEKLANQIIATCKKDSYPPKCYDIEIPKLMDKGLTMEEAFKVTSHVQSLTNGYFFCHVLGHNLSAKESAKDPSKWTEVIARCPTGMCSNGCLHGAAQERFRSESLTPQQIEEVIPQLKSICEPGHERAFTGIESASCYHALGHLSMYITNADIRASTAICKRIAKKDKEDYTSTCFDGAYMQIYQPLEPEDFALVKDIAPQSPAQADKFCSQFTGLEKESCHRESWPLSREKLMTPQGLQDFCTAAGNDVAQKACYNGMFYILMAQVNFEVDRMTPICKGLPTTIMAQCFANAASRCIETDYKLAPKAIELCKVADEQGVGTRCYSELVFYSSFNYHEGSKEFIGLCKQLPSPWKEKCLAGEGKDIHPSATN